MRLTEIATWVWERRVQIPFGRYPDGWPDELFRHVWFQGTRAGRSVWTTKRCGWYWVEFRGEAGIQQVFTTGVSRADDAPEKARDFESTALQNVQMFDDLLCHRLSGLRVVYNGHESDVLRRVRAHVAVSNDKTGALGIRYYPELANHEWVLSVFHAGLAPSSEQARDDRVRATVERLAGNRSGRVAIENAWRAVYGWPILCKA